MPPPVELQQLIQMSLAKVQSDPQHHLTPADRQRIYASFGQSNFPSDYKELKKQLEQTRTILAVRTVADLAVCWLAVLTARKVLPIWQEGQPVEYEGDMASEMLDLVEGLLAGKKEPAKVFRRDYLNNYYHLVGHLSSDVTEQVFFACDSAYAALTTVFFGPPKLLEEDKDLRDDLFVEKNYAWSELATSAVNAWSLIDENQPGDGAEYRRYQRSSQEVRLILAGSSALARYKPLSYDLQKRREFWEWWLSEAVPQAWELAEKQNSQVSK